jgi:hypothetical protein
MCLLRGCAVGQSVSVAAQKGAHRLRTAPSFARASLEVVALREVLQPGQMNK